MSSPPERRGFVHLLFGAFLISFSPVFVRLSSVEPTMAGFYRCLFGGVFLYLVVALRREPVWRGWKPLAFAAGAAALFTADLSFWHRSIAYVGPGLSTILGNFQVFFLAVFGVLVLKERVTPKYLLSIPLAVAGLLMIVGVDWSNLPAGYRRGVYFGLLTALSYASYVLMLQRSRSKEPRLSPASNLAIISILCALFLGIVGKIQGESFRIPSGKDWLLMASYGVICQAIGWIIISRALLWVRASTAGLVLLLQPTLAFLWDVLFFHRPTDITDYLGAALAIAAIYLGGAGRR